jgi:hypothetical protein
MVHHGYRRPGNGSIRGDCPGVGYEPYEVSCELIKIYKSNLEDSVQEHEAHLDELQEGRVQEIRRMELKNRVETTVIYVRGQVPDRDFERVLRERIREVTHRIHYLKLEIGRYTIRIANWKLLPLRTVEEEEVKETVSRAVRAEEVAKRREAKLAKEAATRAKKEALKVKRAAIEAEFANGFRAIAASSESLEVRKAEAMKLAYKMALKKYDYMGARQLECDDVLLLLGLAVCKGDWIEYKYPLKGGHRI